VPLEADLNAAAATPLLEREDECAAIAQQLEAARAGHGGCVIVRGPAGIGKTALLAEARRLAPAAGLRVLAGRGAALERSFAYGAVQQLFAACLGEPSGAAAHAAAAFASEAAEPDHAVPHGLYWLVADLGPLALVLDDAQWLDRPSLRWLAYMAERAHELPVALVLAEDSGEPDEVLEAMRLQPATIELAPAPLSVEAIRRVAEQALGRAPGEDFVRAAAEATAGNPFHLRMLLAEGEAAAPATVADRVALRLGRLPGACGRLARALAVLDRAASGTVAARLAGLGVPETVEAAEALAAADLVRDGAFVHPLVRGAVYGAIPPGERAELHARAARLLGRAGAPPERVAAQIAAGEPGGGEWAVQALRRAARAAWARGAADVTAALLQRAREETMPAQLRVAVLRELAPAVSATDGPAGLPYLYEALGLAEEAAPRAELARELGRALFRQGFFAEAVTILEREAPGAPELATIAVLDLGALRRLGGLERVKAGAPDPVRAWIEVARGPATDGAARAPAAPLDDISRTAALLALTAAGRLEEAEAAWTEVAEAARASGALGRLRCAVTLRALVRLRLGRVADVEADLRELSAWGAELDVPVTDQRLGLPWAVAPLVDALVERGAVEEAQQRVAAAGVEADWPQVLGFTFLLDSLGRLRLAQGRVQEAVRVLRECSRRQRAWGVRNPGVLPWRSSLALALARTGRRAEALELCDEEIDFARQFGVAREEGMALRALAEVTGGAETIPLLRKAVAVLERSPARLEHARALADLGVALAAEAPEQAREALRGALELAAGLGATVVAERAQRTLAATGAPRLPVPAAALSATERRIARLAADGRGTREIAERLFVTEQTVEGHLGQACRKLGIASRGELGAALAPGEPRLAGRPEG
jgi:DNA-binding NarL/FixJ family response regulator